METTTTPPGIVEAQNLDDFGDSPAPMTPGSRWTWTAREDRPIVEVLTVEGTEPDDMVSIKTPLSEHPQRWPVRDFGPGKRFEPVTDEPEDYDAEAQRAALAWMGERGYAFDSLPGMVLVSIDQDGTERRAVIKAASRMLGGLRCEDQQTGERFTVRAYRLHQGVLDGTMRLESAAEEDEGCPVDDPGCESRADERHDACERPGATEPVALPWIVPDDLARITPEACAVEPVEPEQPKRRGRKAAALHSSASNEWYTPVRYIDAARAVMGGIDLDPASCELANKTVQAATYYTAETDGFDKPWPGRVFLNPPYGKEGSESNQARWSERLIEQYRTGLTVEAILLINATTDRSWFKALWQFPICFTDHRISFYGPEGEGSQPTHGNAFVYLGDNTERFREVFEQFGAVVLPRAMQAKTTEPIAKEDVLRALAAADEAEISIAGVLKNGKWNTRLVYPADAESIASILHFTDCLKQELGAKWAEVLQDRRREEEALAAKLGLTA